MKILDSLIFKVILLLTLFSSGLISSDYSEQDILNLSHDCLDCHDEMAESVKETAHEHLTVACVSCHHGKDHVDDPSTANITVPSSDTDIGQLATCTSCHKPHLQMDQVGFDPHQTQGLNCLSCHKIHQSGERLLLDSSGDFCSKCHTGITKQFERRSAHPLEEDIMTCWSCHDFVGDEPNLSNGSSESCLSCHSEMAGPYLHEHEALSSFSTEGGGCVSCHSPHGSSNNRLLKQPGDGLCQQCHSVPRHATAHKGAWANTACMECHSDIHGSYENSNFLDPMIGSKFGDGPDGCYCHTGEN